MTGLPRPQCRICDRNRFVRSCCGAPKIWLGGPCFDDQAIVDEDHPVGDRAGKAHLVGNAEHRHARARQLAHDLQHLVDHLRVEG